MISDGIVKKFKIAPFLNKGTSNAPEWVRLKKSTAFDLAMNPETKEYDYICDESPTTELDKYKPSLNQSITMYKGEPDYDFIFEKFYNLDIGSAAETDFLLAFFMEETAQGGKTYYKAWKCKSVLALSDLNSVDSTITFDISLNGTIEKGYVTVDESGAPEWVASLPA